MSKKVSLRKCTNWITAHIFTEKPSRAAIRWAKGGIHIIGIETF